jgi:hypothetical protein
MGRGGPGPRFLRSANTADLTSVVVGATIGDGLAS